MARFNVKAFRERVGKNQDELAELIGVDARTIRRWENAYSDPSPMALRRLREVQQELIDEDGEQPVRRARLQRPDPDDAANAPVRVTPSRRPFVQ